MTEMGAAAWATYRATAWAANEETCRATRWDADWESYREMSDPVYRATYWATYRAIAETLDDA